MESKPQFLDAIRKAKDKQEPFETDSEIAETTQFYQTVRVKNSLTCLELRYNGMFKAFPYSYIMEFDYSPSDGITIGTSIKKITIAGRNLSKLYYALVDYRIKWIQANIGNDVTDEAEMFISSIEVDDI